LNPRIAPEKRAYQEYMINRLTEEKKLILMVDLGLGKTFCTLSAIDNLMFDKYETEKVLVISTLRIVNIVWPKEMKKWTTLKEFRYSIITGTAKQRMKAIEEDADIYLINRENTKWLIDYFIKLKKWPFDYLVLDESTSFKNSRSQRFRAIRKVAPLTNRVVELTGTPSPNGLMDLWAQIYLLDKGERLGRTIGEYRDRYFNPGQRNRTVIFNYVLKHGAEQAIYDKISDITISLKAKDHIKMPARIDNIIDIVMPPRIKALYETMERDYILTLDEGEITAMSAAVVSNKLLQMANGAVYDENRKVIHIHDLKLEALDEIVETNEGKPIFVIYTYIHDKLRLQEHFSYLNPREINTEQDETDWNNGKIPMVIAHPQSVGHGLNLQEGGCIAVWFGMTNNLEHYLQTNGRLERPGQEDTVVINHLVVKGTEDVRAFQRIRSKNRVQESLLAAVKSRIREIKSRYPPPAI